MEKLTEAKITANYNKWVCTVTGPPFWSLFH